MEPESSTSARMKALSRRSCSPSCAAASRCERERGECAEGAERRESGVGREMRALFAFGVTKLWLAERASSYWD
eukprot:164571-Pleurochrysis_carterae.AAC.1